MRRLLIAGLALAALPLVALAQPFNTICGAGEANPEGGNPGDFYVKYGFGVSGLINSLHIYQNQSGSWVVIQTIG